MTVSNNMQQFLKKQFTRLNNICRIAVDWLQTRSPRSVVWFAFSLLILYTVMALVINPVFFRDSSEYVALVEAFRHGAYERAFPAHLPVLYTVFAGLIAKTGLLSSVSSLLLVSGVATALSVFPVYGILKRCVPSRWASWGTLLYIVFPLFIEYTICPLIDSVKVLFFFCGLYLIFTSDEKFHPLKLAALGFMYACLTLGRAEGILLTGVLCLTHIYQIFLCHKNWCSKILRAGVSVLITLLIMFALIAPRVTQMYKLTGYPVIDSRQSNAVKSVLGELGFLKRITTANTKVNYEDHGGSGWATSDVKILFSQERFFSSFCRSIFYPYIPFVVFGVFLFCKRKVKSKKLRVIALTFLLYNVLYFMLRATTSRYLLVNVILAMPFGLIGMMGVRALLVKYWRAYYSILILCALCFLIFSSIYSLKPIFNRKYDCFKQFKSYFVGKSQYNTTLKRPVVLLIGSDRGLGYYSDVNVVWYQKQGLFLDRSVTDVIRHGASLKYLFYGAERDLPETLYIDAVVLDNKNHPDDVIEAEMLLEAPIKHDRLTLYKVKSGLDQNRSNI